MTANNFTLETKELIDELKSTCANYGLGNDGNEFKIIIQVFLYKFLNDKFAYEIKKLDKKIAKAKSWEKAIRDLSEDDFEMLKLQLSADTAYFKPDHFITTLFDRQNEAKFSKLFDDTLVDIAKTNTDIFSFKFTGGEKVILFERVSEYITNTTERDAFCKAIINKLVKFSFEKIFGQGFDFFATIFEYMIKDYNKDNGGKYAEYYTPHAVAKIMAAILVPPKLKGKIKDVSCYDPSAGSGTLLMNLAHAIGEDKCSIFSQDISQKSSSLLRLNLILNNLTHSIPNIIQGNTILKPYHREGQELKHFDFIVSNPPFKMDFSDFRNDLESKENHERFFAGLPNVPAKDKSKMAIYLLFIQHIMFSLKENGKAAVVVPTGFITAQSGIEKKIRTKLVEEKMLGGVVSMPSNIFATTGTNVSILFIDRNNKSMVILIDASGLGETVKEGKNQKTVLTAKEEKQIIDTFNQKKVVDDFSVVVDYDEIAAKNYSLSAGQYFDVKIEYVDITQKEFNKKMKGFSDNLDSMFKESKSLETKIKKQLSGLKFHK